MGVVALALMFHVKYQAAHFFHHLSKSNVRGSVSCVLYPICLLSPPFLPRTRPKVSPLTGSALKGAVHQYFITAMTQNKIH